MSVGYPDYARLSLAGGQQLYSANGNIPENTVLFKGYVGLWPYVTLFTLVGASADFCQIVLVYYSDDTFTTQVGFRYAIRRGTSLATTQYANVSPWLEMYLITKSGNAMPFSAIGLYGASGPANQVGLASLDVPIYQTTQSIASGGLVTVQPQHIQPGNASFIASVNATSWYVNLAYYDWGSGGYLVDSQIYSIWAGKGGSFDIPMLDAPYNITMHNGDAAAQNFNLSWKSKLAATRRKQGKMTPTEVSLIIAVLTFVSSVGTCIFIVGVGWGTVKTDVRNIREDLTEIRSLYRLTPIVIEQKRDPW